MYERHGQDNQNKVFQNLVALHPQRNGRKEYHQHSRQDVVEIEGQPDNAVIFAQYETSEYRRYSNYIGKEGFRLVLSA